MGKKLKKKKSRAKRGANLSKDEKAKRQRALKHKVDIRTVFTNCGFTQVPTRDKQVNIAERQCEFDSIFVYENLVVVVEDTAISAPSKIVDHLRGKVEIFEHVDANPLEFLKTIKATFERFDEYTKSNRQYRLNDYMIYFVYASRYDFDNKYKSRYNDICNFLDYSYLRYFLSIAKTIQLSARFELLKFLTVDLNDVGVYSSSHSVDIYDGLLLPESPSGFPEDHQLVSFLVDPQMLLEQTYVLRADSWRDNDCLYQRLLTKSKIQNMRKYLATQGRVYINNIIVTLPFDTSIRDISSERIARTSVSNMKPVTIEIPRRFCSIGIIDGQHRVFSYHEGSDVHDTAIAVLRQKQHLLVTGIVYPKSISENKKQLFEAQLFLEINNTQKRVAGDLKQAISLMVEPNSAIAIAKAVIYSLASSGPLSGLLEIHFYDVGKIKTASIVSYGLRHIVNIEGESSFYKKWRGHEKNKIRSKKAVRDKYIQHCATELNMMFGGFKTTISDDLWTTDRKTSRVLTTTTINGLIYCMRLLIENDAKGDFNYYKRRFGLSTIKYRPDKFPFKSSHWKALGVKLYEECFA